MNGLIIYALLMLFVFSFASLFIVYVFLNAMKKSLIEIISLRDDLIENEKR